MSDASDPEANAGVSFFKSPFSWAIENAGVVAIWAFMFGFAMCCIAVALQVHVVDFTGRFSAPALRDYVVALGPSTTAKEVGYLFAINWSVLGVFVQPLVLYFGLRTFANMAPALEAIAERGMVRDQTFEKVTAESVLARWRRSERVNRSIFYVIFLLCTLFLAFDWWQVVAQPILDPGIIARNHILLSDPSLEFDWSISCIFEGSRTSCAPLLAFGAVGYLFMACLLTSFAFGVAVAALHFSAFVLQRGGAAQRWRFFADVSDEDDRRCGWEVFGPFYSNLLCTGLGVLVGLWLMVMQNSYLRAPDAPNIANFIFQEGRDFLDIFETQVADLPQTLLNWIVAPGVSVFSSTQSGLGILLFGFVCLIALLASWWLLRATAAEGRRQAQRSADVIARDTALPVETIRARLRKMQFWPVGWISEVWLLTLMLVLFASLFSYRIVLIPVVYLIVRAIDASWKAIFSRRKEQD
ncbi:MAG: hypothetical protein JNJ73_21735 [Hyphomonadaceae bacterium]|nr:hypothetical protein [Hyphomonadaceae bacterium]